VTTVHVVLGVLTIALNGAAGLWGGWLWWRVEAQPAFWPLLRAGQATLVVEVLLGAVLVAIDREPAELHVLYGLLPIGVAFLAEQLRLVAAESVLARHGLSKARDMEGLPEEKQRQIVLEIVRRETGVMAAGALVVTVLALRAAGVTGALPI
jgi:hypothetical protein